MDALTEAAHISAEMRSVLELALDPADAASLWRTPILAPWRQGRRVGHAALSVVWHDTADGALAAAGVAVAEQRLGARTRWRLEGLYPTEASGRWLAASTAPLLAEAAGPEGLIGALQHVLRRGPLDPLLEVGRFEGGVRRLRNIGSFGMAALSVANGMLDGKNGQRAACRAVLEGADSEIFAQAQALAGTVRLAVPRSTLAAEAAALRGLAIPPRHLGAPTLAASATVDEALATLVSQLGDVLLHWASLVSPDAGEEPVHQMRVALRRLRSALKLFGRAADCPGLDAAQDSLRALGRALGGVRDWDVFLGGLGRTIAAAFPSERAISRMLTAAERQRRSQYAALAVSLQGPEFRRTCLKLAELAATRPWQGWVPAEA